MDKKPKEWLEQAEYDMDTAEYMFDGGRFFYSVFMCHLSIEKALKGMYVQKLKDTPPKTHNLIFLVEKIGIKLPDDLYDFVYTLNGVSVPTRYPDDLKQLLKSFDKAKTIRVLKKSKEVLRWLNARLEK
ncbi:MAG: HEPN domain-containing protein [Phycisphaerae bacterium]